MNEAIKAAVLKRIGHGGTWRPEGRAGHRFNAGLVHVRYKTSGPFSFNLNPATLRSDYELWICGTPDYYYLLPIATVREMYYNPDAYVEASPIGV